jgi:hypothetical protein
MSSQACFLIWSIAVCKSFWSNIELQLSVNKLMISQEVNFYLYKELLINKLTCRSQRINITKLFKKIKGQIRQKICLPRGNSGLWKSVVIFFNCFLFTY